MEVQQTTGVFVTYFLFCELCSKLEEYMHVAWGIVKNILPIQESQIRMDTWPTLTVCQLCLLFKRKNAIWFNFVGMGLAQWSLHAVGSIGVNFVWLSLFTFI